MKAFCKLCLIFLMFSTFLRPAETEGASLTRIRAGYPSPSATFYPLFAAKEAGLLEKYGFDTEMIYVQGVQLIQVHVSGQLDFSTISAVVYLQASVEGGVISFPTSLNAEKLGVKTLFDFAESDFDIPATTVVISRKYGQTHREAVLRFLKAYVEGTSRLMTDRDLGIKALRKYGGVSDRDLLAYTYDLFTTRYIKKIPKINPKGVANSLSLIAENNPKAKGRRAEEFMDTSFMDELEKTGFIKSVWP